MLQSGVTESEKLKKTMLDNVGKMLKKPGVNIQSDSDKTTPLELSEKLMQQVMDVERQTVEGTDLSVLYEVMSLETLAYSLLHFTMARCIYMFI